MNTDFDVFIVGGGINGAGIARDAAGRGYKVCLAEMSDISSGTSSWSTKLIHGGLRYMEQFQLRLVREALIERENLLSIAPHIIRPLRFILPHSEKSRPLWMLSLGMFIYDNLARRKVLRKSEKINLNKASEGKELKDNFAQGFEYSDCWVEDSRLVLLNARDAYLRGARIMTRSKVVSLKWDNNKWEILVQKKLKNKIKNYQFSSKMVVNAAGPWVNEINGQLKTSNGLFARTRLVKGSHIVLPKLVNHEKAFIFQNFDNRVIFVIPFEKQFSLIGTTDEEFSENPSEVKISKKEIDYLCESVSTFFKKPISSKDIVWTFSGVRSLYDDGEKSLQKITREYVIKEENEYDKKILSIYGGKITTYRKLAEKVLKIIDKQFNKTTYSWTSKHALPGGDFEAKSFSKLLKHYQEKYNFIERGIIERLFMSYGTQIDEMLRSTKSIKDLGKYFGNTLYEIEVKWMINSEWAEKVEDILWRRSKLGLNFSSSEVNNLKKWMEKNIN